MASRWTTSTAAGEINEIVISASAPRRVPVGPEMDGGASGFLIERSVDFGKSWAAVATVPADARTVTVNAKVGDQFRVRAFGPGGLSDGPITSIGSMQRRRAERH